MLTVNLRLRLSLKFHVSRFKYDWSRAPVIILNILKRTMCLLFVFVQRSSEFSPNEVSLVSRLVKESLNRLEIPYRSKLPLLLYRVQIMTPCHNPALLLAFR